MSSPRIGRNANTIVLDRARTRQTPPPRSTFNEILQGSKQVLLSGAQVASQVVGLPALSAAVSRARVGSDSSSSSSSSNSSSSSSNSSSNSSSSSSNSSSSSSNSNSSIISTVSGGRIVSSTDGNDGKDANAGDQMKTLMDQRMNDDLKLLALQSEIQRQNRQVSLVSNVMKARHDTAKSAIGNIRS